MRNRKPRPSECVFISSSAGHHAADAAAEGRRWDSWGRGRQGACLALRCSLARSGLADRLWQLAQRGTDPRFCRMARRCQKVANMSSKPFRTNAISLGFEASTLGGDLGVHVALPQRVAGNSKHSAKPKALFRAESRSRRCLPGDQGLLFGVGRIEADSRAVVREAVRSIGAHLAPRSQKHGKSSAHSPQELKLRNYVLSPLAWEPSSQSCPVFGWEPDPTARALNGVTRPAQGSAFAFADAYRAKFREAGRYV